jgi:hypothetical protein
MPDYSPDKPPQSRTIGKFFIFFGISFVVIFVDLHFFSFFPLTVRDPPSVPLSAAVALFGGLWGGTYAIRDTFV